MSDVVLKVTDLSKTYRLGEIGTGTLSDDLKRWWFRLMGKEDPFAKVIEANDRTKAATSDYVMALDHLNFEVEQGEILGIIGKNGAGKSTLLKILSKVTGPSTGDISIKGRVASLLEVGTGFHPELTGRENIYLNGTILGMTRKEVKAKLDEIVDFAGIRRYLDTPVKRYSSGMTVRLGFAVAAHLEPDILIVDEVLAVGDAEFQAKAIGKMQSVSRSGHRTVLFVSHNLGSVSSLCTRTLYVKDGRIAMDGPTDTVIQRYLEDSMYEGKNKNLLAEKNRAGNGTARITAVRLVNPLNGREIDGIIAGEPMEFHLDYTSEMPVINELEAGIQLFNSTGTFITDLNNRMTKGLYRDASGTGTVICAVPKTPFMSGHFHVDVSIACNKALSDHVQNAFSFVVHEGDYYGSNYPNARERQGVYIDHHWKLPEAGK